MGLIQTRKGKILGGAWRGFFIWVPLRLHLCCEPEIKRAKSRLEPQSLHMKHGDFDHAAEHQRPSRLHFRLGRQHEVTLNRLWKLVELWNRHDGGIKKKKREILPFRSGCFCPVIWHSRAKCFACSHLFFVYISSLYISVWSSARNDHLLSVCLSSQPRCTFFFLQF